MSTSPLTGSKLLNLIAEMTDHSRAEVARACGYISITNGRERINYTAFYTAVLEARAATERSGPTPPSRRPDDAPSVYVASLSDYNAGILHGRWIDLTMHTTQKDIQAEIDAMLAQSPTAARYGEPAEEWAFHDSENCRVEEFDSTETLEAIAEDYGQCQDDRLDWLLHLKWKQAIGQGYGTVEEFRDSYRGAYDSGDDFAWDLIDEICNLEELPELIRHNIDYSGAWEELHSGDFWELRHQGQSHIFSH